MIRIWESEKKNSCGKLFFFFFIITRHITRYRCRFVATVNGAHLHENATKATVTFADSRVGFLFRRREPGWQRRFTHDSPPHTSRPPCTLYSFVTVHRFVASPVDDETGAGRGDARIPSGDSRRLSSGSRFTVGRPVMCDGWKRDLLRAHHDDHPAVLSSSRARGEARRPIRARPWSARPLLSLPARRSPRSGRQRCCRTKENKTPATLIICWSRRRY